MYLLHVWRENKCFADIIEGNSSRENVVEYFSYYAIALIIEEIEKMWQLHML